MSAARLLDRTEVEWRARGRGRRRPAPPTPWDAILGLQRSHGNAQVQRLIAIHRTGCGPAGALLQRDNGTTATEEPTAATQVAQPYEALRDYGSFVVYPDDFVGPLQVADPTIGPWAIRESDFAALEIALESVRGGAAGIEILGEGSFKTAVLLDFAWLLTAPSGRELVDEIVASGKNLTIEASSGGNTTSYSPNDDSFERPDGTPGPGADVTIGYNPTEWNPYGEAEEWMTRPPAIGLAHELVHAWTGMSGIRALGETPEGLRRRELQATGLGEFAGARLSENRFRAAFGLPTRPRY